MSSTTISAGPASKLPLSVFIIAKDEEDRIHRAILGVRDWVDEVIVVDSGSTDGTVALAQALGARTVYHEWAGYGPQKRYGESLCRNDWVLNLDADEEVPPAAADEIKALFAGGRPDHAAYEVKLKAIFPFEKTPNFFAVTAICVRLYDKSRMGFKDSTVHDSVALPKGMKPARLHADLFHRSLRSHAHIIDKINFYTSMQAEDLFAKGRRFSGLRVVLTPLWAFFKAYVLRGYLFYGVNGVIEAYIYSIQRFLRAAKTRERFQAEAARPAEPAETAPSQTPRSQRKA